MDERERRIRQARIKRRRNILIMKCIIALLLVLMIIMIILLVSEMIGTLRKNRSGTRIGEGADGTVTIVSGAEDENAQDAGDGEQAGGNGLTGSAKEVKAAADILAAQYDYDGAIEMVRAYPDFAKDTALQDAIADYEQKKAACTAFPLDQVTHVFFHTLVKDDAKAFDGDAKEAGYNQVMTTISEFNSMIQQMYDRGFVMVSLHDMCQVNADGTVTQKNIYLPAGRKPFVLSQDDVSYYHYMDGDGFAEKLIVDENGEIKNTYIEDDGSVSVGDYDMVPLIDTFVKEHPDFSYHGHKGIVALTGYEGVLGYRTDEVYRTRQADRVTHYQQAFFDTHPDFDWQAEVDEATHVANVMKEEGWEFASHTWGHINPLGYGYDATVQDTERWLGNVATVVGSTDVLIFAFGADIGDWHPYTTDNSFFTYLKSQGFSIFCNVDSNTYWVQFGSTYMRQGRRNLDGYRMYYNPEMLTDLFNVEEAWDNNRPMPVPPI